MTEANMKRPLLSVGSMPYGSAEETFCACGPTLGSVLPALSDGEFGERWDWIGYLERQVYAKHPDLIPDSQNLDRSSEEWGQSVIEGDRDAQYQDEGLQRAFSIRPGVTELRFDDLYFGAVAVESYGVFRRLRDEGVIPPEVRFQLCLPGVTSAVEPYFSRPSDWPAAKRAYLEGVATEIGRLLEVIPADDLVVQFDLCFEIMDLTLGDQPSLLEWAPRRTASEKWQEHTAQLRDLGAAVPDTVQLGYHLCYGTWGGWPMVDLTDISLCVALANECVAKSGRQVDFVHAPIGANPDDGYFEAAKDLALGDTRLFLGIIHPEDGVDGFRKRAELARKHIDEFGVAGVCGFGRHRPEEAAQVLRLLADCAEIIS